MTVVVGIRCSDGIVIGSDGAATLMSQGLVTAQQRAFKKIFSSGSVITAFAGHSGLAQRIRGEIEGGLAEGRWTGRTDQIVHQMRRHLWHHITELELRAAGASQDALRHHAAPTAATTETLVAAVINGLPELIHFDGTCGTTVITDDLPFVSIGAGQPIADPFLGFARRIFWPSGLPNLATATFSVLWTLTHAIECNAIGLAQPIQLATLTRDGEQWVASDVTQNELEEHRQSVSEAEDALRAWRNRVAGTGTLPAVSPPPT